MLLLFASECGLAYSDMSERVDAGFSIEDNHQISFIRGEGHLHNFALRPLLPFNTFCTQLETLTSGTY